MMCSFHVRLRHTLVLAFGLAAGCSGGDGLPREAVSGTVTLDNQPLANGVIQFTPADGGAAGSSQDGGGGRVGGTQIKDGQFSIARDQGLVPGKYNVAINAAAKSEQAKPKQVGGRMELPKELIPAEYNSATKLTAEVKKGDSNNFTFSLKSKPE